MYAAKQRGRNGWQHYRAQPRRGTRRAAPARGRSQAGACRHADFRRLPADRRRADAAASSRSRRWRAGPIRRWGRFRPTCSSPIAEESGLIVELGRQILEQACLAARDWPFRLAVNLSPAQFWHRNLVEEVMATLERCDFPPSRLEFEITETYLLSRPEAAEAVIRTLRRRGVRIALDDFGTGYASIGYLRRFQFDLVKIDRSLVEAVVSDQRRRRRLRGDRVLCRALGLPILAEGRRNRRTGRDADGEWLRIPPGLAFRASRCSPRRSTRWSPAQGRVTPRGAHRPAGVQARAAIGSVR